MSQRKCLWRYRRRAGVSQYRQGALRQLAVAPRNVVIPSMPAQVEASAQRPIKRPVLRLVAIKEDAVPDFLGLSMRGAWKKPNRRISLKMQGGGYVVKREPGARRRRQEQQVVVCIWKADTDACSRVLNPAGGRAD
jgi:hypothetical protein